MEKDITYILKYGERGNGKTEIMYHFIIDRYLYEDLPTVYVRRDQMIKKGNLETLFTPHIPYNTEKLIETDKQPFVIISDFSTFIKKRR